MTLYNDFIMTQDFVDRYSQNDPGTTLDRARDHCDDAWPWSDDSAYAADFFSWPDDNPDVTRRYWVDKPLKDRLEQAVDWLHSEDPWWWSSSDSVIVLDHNKQRDHEGRAWIGSAITDFYRGGIVDYAYEGDLNWSPIDNISHHELIHTYDSVHDDAGIFSDDDATAMASWNDDGAVEHGCYNYGDDGKNERLDYNSYCEENSVESYIDSNT